MTETLSRRAALKSLVTATGAIGAVAVLPLERVAAAAAAAGAKPAGGKPEGGKPAAAAAGLPHVGPQDPTAIALSYFEDAGKVDAKKYPTFKAGQKCANCLQSKGAATDAWVTCNLFPGKMVASGGWCKVYVKRP
jgi:High potential iron-sulfur protein